MADWEYHIHLNEVWKDYDEEIINVVTAGRKVAEVLRSHKAYSDGDGEQKDALIEIILLFENESETEEEFNIAMNELYDWGDTDIPTPHGRMQRKLAFIHTIF